MTEDKMVGWHHQLNGHEFEQTLGDSEGQGSLACCSPWGCKELDTTERLTTTTRQKDRGWDTASSNYSSHPPEGWADPLGLSLELFSSLSTHSKSY